MVAHLRQRGELVKLLKQVNDSDREATTSATPNREGKYAIKRFPRGRRSLPLYEAVDLTLEEAISDLASGHESA